MKTKKRIKNLESMILILMNRVETLENKNNKDLPSLPINDGWKLLEPFSTGTKQIENQVTIS